MWVTCTGGPGYDLLSQLNRRVVQQQLTMLETLDRQELHDLLSQNGTRTFNSYLLGSKLTCRERVLLAPDSHRVHGSAVSLVPQLSESPLPSLSNQGNSGNYNNQQG